MDVWLVSCNNGSYILYEFLRRRPESLFELSWVLYDRELDKGGYGWYL